MTSSDDLVQALLTRASAAAGTGRERQWLAIAGTHLAGESDRAGVLAADHLADHPDDVAAALLAALIAHTTRSDPNPFEEKS